MYRRLAPLALIALLATACAGAGESSNLAPMPPAEGGGSNGALVDKGESLVPVPGAPTGDGSALIVTSSLTLVVDELDASIAAARATITKLGGTLVGISRGSDGGYPIYREDGSIASIGDGPVSLTFRLPADTLEPAIDALRSLGEVTSERTDASDVSASLRDLGARLKNLRAAEANYQRLLERAESISDLLAVTAQLDVVRGEIERLAAEAAYLEDAVARSTLSLTLYPPAAPIDEATASFDLGATIEQAIGSLVGIAIWLVTLGVYAVILGLPALLLGLVAYRLVGRRLVGRIGGRGRSRR
jgi:hypothetical protein